MEIKTDKYTKVVLTIIAITLIMLLFKPQVQQSFTPPSANALTQIDGVVDSSGNKLFLTDVLVRNPDNLAVPVKPTQKIEVYWEKPMPVYVIEQKKDK